MKTKIDKWFEVNNWGETIEFIIENTDYINYSVGYKEWNDKKLVYTIKLQEFEENPSSLLPKQYSVEYHIRKGDCITFDENKRFWHHKGTKYSKEKESGNKLFREDE